MSAPTPAPTKDQIKELRNLFTDKYEKHPPAVPFHSIDINRVKNEDLWCTRFLEMYDLNMKEAFDKLWETCTWRQQFGANDLNETNLRMEYLMDGVVFARNKDIDNKPLLIFKTKLHIKGTKDMDEVMRVVIYWIERIHRDTNMEKITIFFDMAGTGLTSLDLDFVKRIIDTFKQYYPNALNYILIFEMAWVLNAAFKVIKGFLPEKALQILKMISRKDINTYIDKNNCLQCWGGNDAYEFTFIPEKRAEQTKLVTQNGVKANGTIPSGETHNKSNGVDKKVHFANMSDMSEFKEHYTPDEYDMLRISPKDVIVFTRGEDNGTNIEITCTSKIPVTYKIQTTSPEKFRVRPRCGILSAGDTISINIILKPEFQLADGSKDKFLIMGLPVPDGVELSPQQMTELWKQKPPNSSEVEQHRLCCNYKGSTEPTVRNGFGNAGSTGLDNKHNIVSATDHASKLEKQLRRTQCLQSVTLVFLIVLSVAVAYLLKLQLSNSGDGDADFEAGVCDYNCPKGRNL